MKAISYSVVGVNRRKHWLWKNHATQLLSEHAQCAGTSVFTQARQLAETAN